MTTPKDANTETLKRALLMQRTSRSHTSAQTQVNEYVAQEPIPGAMGGIDRTKRPEKIERPENLRRPENPPSRLRREEETHDLSAPPTFIAQDFNEHFVSRGSAPLPSLLEAGQETLRRRRKADAVRRTETIMFKLSPFENDAIRRAALSAGFDNLSAFIRSTVLAEAARMENAGKMLVAPQLDAPEDVSIRDFVKKDRSNRSRL